MQNFRSNHMVPSETSVLFVGLGTMGLPMASNMLTAGFRVAGADMNEAAVATFVKRGGMAATDAAKAAASADVLVSMLPDDAIVDAVLGGGAGLISAMRSGALVVEMSTTGPDTKIDLARAANARGIDFIEAPVGRTVDHAIAGTLALMTGGDPVLIKNVRPLLSAMGSEIHICGDVGAGSAIKLINNALVAAINAASIEALIAGRKAGIELETMFLVLKTTMAWNNALSTALPKKALRRDFRPGFMTKLQHKDVRLALGMAEQLGAPMPMAGAAFDLLDKAVASGFGSDDGSGSMLRVCEAAGGVVLELGEPVPTAKAG
ncbi:NAD(P)-dependent oxidoreductase [Mesorhizobium sp. 1B3]|uniref:NAD(P)-dependent oxidoreductase n=1 Tax=Mesorhizobium sp. 1B3 TaxID=3243599 RepID=UPI003D97116A